MKSWCPACNRYYDPSKSCPECLEQLEKQVRDADPRAASQRIPRCHECWNLVVVCTCDRWVVVHDRRTGFTGTVRRSFAIHILGIPPEACP